MATAQPHSSGLDRIETASRDEIAGAPARTDEVVRPPRLRELALLPQALRRPRRASGRPQNPRRPRQVPFHRQAGPARHLSLRHVRRAARAALPASTAPPAPPASRPSSATPERTSRPGRTWSPARSTPPAGGRATWCMSPTAMASSPAAWARTTAPSASAAPSCRSRAA